MSTTLHGVAGPPAVQQILLVAGSAIPRYTLTSVLEQAGYVEPDMLLAHIHATLRRSVAARRRGPLLVGDLWIDPASYRVTLRGRPIALPPKEFRILQVLAAAAGRVVSTTELFEHVWEAGYIGQPEVVYVHVRWLRERIEDHPNQPRRLQTVHGVGYRLVGGD